MSRRLEIASWVVTLLQLAASLAVPLTTRAHLRGMEASGGFVRCLGGNSFMTCEATYKLGAAFLVLVFVRATLQLLALHFTDILPAVSSFVQGVFSVWWFWWVAIPTSYPFYGVRDHWHALLIVSVWLGFVSLVVGMHLSRKLSGVW